MGASIRSIGRSMARSGCVAISEIVEGAARELSMDPGDLGGLIVSWAVLPDSEVEIQVRRYTTDEHLCAVLREVAKEVRQFIFERLEMEEEEQKRANGAKD